MRPASVLWPDTTLTHCKGGRFREQYYWDSFWIVEGLLESELYDIVNATLHNFMDELELIGFIPNGGRIYYLNRSQPPLFVQVCPISSCPILALLTRASDARAICGSDQRDHDP